jgi:hypothetical protein
VDPTFPAPVVAVTHLGIVESDCDASGVKAILALGPTRVARPIYRFSTAEHTRSRMMAHFQGLLFVSTYLHLGNLKIVCAGDFVVRTSTVAWDRFW